MPTTAVDTQAATLTRIACFLADRIPDPVLFCDRAGTVLAANAALEDETGRSRSDLVGQPLTGIFEGEAFSSWPGNAETSEEGWTVETRVRTPEGHRTRTVRAVALRWGSEPAYAFCLIFEEDMHRSPAVAHRISDGCSAVGRYASILAHDLRNPLTGISTGIQYLGHALKGNPQHTETIGIIQAEVNNLNECIERLAQVAQTTPEFEPSTLNLAVALREILSTWQSEIARRNVPVSVKVDPLLPAIPGDASRMTRALSAIFGRALGLAREGSPLQVRLELRSTASHRPPGAVPSQWAVVEISGTSSHSDPREDLQTLNPSSPDWGAQADFYLAAGIVEAHKGYFELAAGPENRMRFSVVLPIHHS
ncbi:MAG: PAS domain-containing protein [Candidatus Eisenbacteria sp.]|nr:PAS domain-containing protein [Candidatus Eisenbacteria bacterium]